MKYCDMICRYVKHEYRSTKIHEEQNMTQTTLVEPIVITGEAMTKQSTNQLDLTIIEAIDESLTSFGESVKQVVYFQLENTYHVKKQDIPRKIEEFVKAVEGIFGIGARLIEMKILQTLYARMHEFTYFPESKDLVFRDYVQSIQSFFQ